MDEIGISGVGGLWALVSFFLLRNMYFLDWLMGWLMDGLMD